MFFSVCYYYYFLQCQDYIDISKATGPFTLKFNLGSTTFARSWKIRIVQFKTGDACAAPSGCSLVINHFYDKWTSQNENVITIIIKKRNLFYSILGTHQARWRHLIITWVKES